MTNDKQIIIGITGTLGAGKGTVVDILIKEFNFKHYCATTFITEEIKARGLDINRENMQNVANDLRTKNSPSYIIEQLYNKAKKNKNNIVIESLRAVGEVEELQKKENFYLLAIDANSKTRYERIQLRKSLKDNISYEQFKNNEEREMNSTNPNLQNLKKCIEMANFKLNNDETLEELDNQVQKIIKTIETIKTKEKYIRPTWDEYFLDMIQVIAKRATCDRGRTACVIVKDKKILVTGYVGSPIGLPHCDDVGHQMKKVIHEDNSISSHCVRTVHAEQNAICQAARQGVSLEGATIYAKLTPCRVCAMLLINCGIKRIVCQIRYHAGFESEEMFKRAGIELVILNKEIEKYENQ